MHTKKELIEKRLREAFRPSEIRVVDDSHAHQGHPGYQGGERHFSIEIKSNQLNAMDRITAHRQVYAVFNDLIPDTIHALRIKLIS